jgi:hypothetical protein
MVGIGSMREDNRSVVLESLSFLNDRTLQQELDAARIFRQQKKDGISFTGPEGPIKDRFVVMERVDVGNKIQREKVVVDQ